MFNWTKRYALPLLIFVAAVVGAKAYNSRTQQGFHGTFSDPYPRMVRQVFDQVGQRYIEPQRVEAVKLLEGALKALETSYPEVLAAYDPETNSVQVEIEEKKKSFAIPPRPTLKKIAGPFSDILNFIAFVLGGDVEKEDVFYLGINGAIGELDPHSRVFNPKHFKEFMIGTRGSFGGIGFVFGIRDGEMTIITPIDDTPAARKGLKSGDRIKFIDGEPTINMPVDTAANKMRGKPGTKVTLTIERDEWGDTRDLTFVREKIEVESVESFVLQGEGKVPVFYARIKNFQKNTTDELEKSFREAEMANPSIAGIILDLRNNPGGLLDQAVELSDRFMDRGTIVSTRGRGTDTISRSAASEGDTISDKPLVVLVNQGSASASEIVSGALQANRAVVLGQKTFGKGSVQKLYPLSDGGALKLTVAQYLTPGDVSIQSVGIQPDISLYQARIEDNSARIGPPPKHRNEADLENAFNDWSDKTKLASSRRIQYLSVIEVEEDEEPEDKPDKSFAELEDDEKIAKLEDDFLIKSSIKVLAAARSKGDSRKALLTVSGEVFDTIEKQEQARVAEAIEAAGIDWSAGPLADPKALKAEFDRDVLLEGGSEGLYSIKITNVSAAPVHRVWGRTKCDNPMFDNLDFVFGKLEPGESKSWSAKVKPAKGAVNRWDPVKLSLGEGGEEFLEGAGSLHVVPSRKPSFEYSYAIKDFDAKGISDGVINTGDRVKMVLKVKNSGEVAGEKVRVNIGADRKEKLYLEAARDTIENLAPGAVVDSEMSFLVKKPSENKKVVVNVSITDQESGSFFSDVLEIMSESPYGASGDRAAPDLDVVSGDVLKTESEEADLVVNISDDKSVKEFYVLHEDKKIMYERNKTGGETMKARVKIKLNPGSNRIILSARDSEDIASSEMFYIYRTSGVEELASKPSENGLN